MMDLHMLHGCRGGRQAWTHYELLGIATDEQAPEVIEEAAVRRSNLVRAYQLTREAECTRLLGAIARAVVVLLDPARRAEYDRGLGKPPGATPARRPAPVAAAAPRACDVRLVSCT